MEITKITEEQKRILELCDKLKKGYTNKHGQPIYPNPYIEFETFAKYLMFDLGMRNQTTIDYLRWVHKFQAEVNEQNLSEWEKYVMTYRVAGTEAKQRLNYLTYLTLKLYLKAVNKQDLLRYLPDTKDVPKPHSEPVYQGINNDDWDKLLGYIDNEVIRDTTILMRRLGLRVGEIINMRKKWISLGKVEGKFIISIPKKVSKSGRNEEVPIDVVSYKIIKKYIEGKEDKDLIFTIDDRELNYNDWVVPFSKIQETYKIKVHPHLFRHQFAHDLERDFLGSEIQLLMRHSNIAITSRYLKKEQTKVFEKFYKMEGK